MINRNTPLEYQVGNFGGLPIIQDATTVMYNHPWKIHTRLLSGSCQYTICETSVRSLSGYPNSFNAGSIYAPDCSIENVSATAWTTISSSTDIWLNVTVNLSSVFASIGTSSVAGNYYDDPAKLNYNIGSITVVPSGSISVKQKLNADISLVGAIIPAWYANYNKTGLDQILIHSKNAAPNWFISATDTKERIIKYGTDNTLGVFIASDASTDQVVITKSNVFDTAPGDGDCA